MWLDLITALALVALLSVGVMLSLYSAQGSHPLMPRIVPPEPPPTPHYPDDDFEDLDLDVDLEPWKRH